jgi:tetratricopeptide (TPR) repeat protein
MYNLLIALAAYILTAVLLTTLTPLGVWSASLLAMLAFVLVYILLFRHIMKKIGLLMELAQRDLQAGRSEKAVRILESGFKYAPWQFYVRGQLNSQIGTILYLKREFSEAYDYLRKGFIKHWVAQGMLAICYMKRNKTSQMIDTFEKTVGANKKEPLLWNLYAYCLERVGERDKAVKIMEKGIQKTGGDENLKANLQALQEGRRMKMLAYGDMWYQFHLEKPGAIIRQQTKAIQGRRKIVRR